MTSTRLMKPVRGKNDKYMTYQIVSARKDKYKAYITKEAKNDM